MGSYRGLPSPFGCWEEETSSIRLPGGSDIWEGLEDEVRLVRRRRQSVCSRQRGWPVQRPGGGESARVRKSRYTRMFCSVAYTRHSRVACRVKTDSSGATSAAGKGLRKGFWGSRAQTTLWTSLPAGSHPMRGPTHSKQTLPKLEYKIHLNQAHRCEHAWTSMWTNLTTSFLEERGYWVKTY